MEVRLRIGGIAVDRLVNVLDGSVVVAPAFRPLAARKALARPAWRGSAVSEHVAELRVHVQPLALAILLVEVIKARDQIEAAVQPLVSSAR